MQFGKKKKDAPERGSGTYLRRFQKGETKVRFLDEPDEWIEYWEHFTPDRKSFPCTEERDSCPGCTHDNEAIRKASRKYATQLLLVKQQQVLPFIVPISLADRLSARAEKNGGTLINRDYAVMRSGDGFDTEYDVDQEDKYPVDVAALRSKITLDIQDCFKDAFTAVWGTLDAKGSPSDIADTHTPGDENPPTEPAANQDAGESEDAGVVVTEATADGAVVLTEAKIRAMEKPELRDLCDTAGLKYDSDETKSELIEKLLKEFGE